MYELSTISAHCVIQHWFWVSDRLLILQATPFADEACETIVRTESCWKTRKSSFSLFATTSQVSTCHLCAWGPCIGICRAMALIGDAKQATSEGKWALVETGLTGPAATALG